MCTDRTLKVDLEFGQVIQLCPKYFEHLYDRLDFGFSSSKVVAATLKAFRPANLVVVEDDYFECPEMLLLRGGEKQHLGADH